MCHIPGRQTRDGAGLTTAATSGELAAWPQIKGGNMTHDVLQKSAERSRLAEQMATWERKYGKPVTMGYIDRSPSLDDAVKQRARERAHNQRNFAGGKSA